MCYTFSQKQRLHVKIYCSAFNNTKWILIKNYLQYILRKMCVTSWYVEIDFIFMVLLVA